MPAAGVVAVQVLLVVLVLNNLWAGSVSPLGWVPDAWSRCAATSTVLAEAGGPPGVVDAGAGERPPPSRRCSSASARCWLLVVEVLVGTVRRVPLAGLPLIAALTVPVSLLGRRPAVLAFALAAVSFALLMAAEQTLRVGQWGLGHWGGQRDDEDRHSDTEVGLPSTLPPALGVGVAGVLVAVVAPILLPSGLGLLERFGSGGSGDGTGGALELSNPMLNMQRDLVQGSNDPVLQIATNDPSPDYLRLTVLDEFDGEAWRPSERDIPPTNQADERLPQPRGCQRHPQAGLPHQHGGHRGLREPVAADALPGHRRVGLGRLAVRQRDPRHRRVARWRSPRPRSPASRSSPTPQDLVDAPLPPRGIERLGTDLPDEMPDFIERTAEEVTEGATSDFERIVMLQRWFREEGGFEYTTDTSSGNGLEQLEVFLGDGPGSREGYCEQFATALALMARSPRHPGAGVGRLPRARARRRRHVGLQPPRPARLAGDLLRGCRLDAVRPHALDRVRRVPEYTSGQLPSEQQTTGPTDVPSDVASQAPRDLRRDDLLTGAEDTTTDEGSTRSSRRAGRRAAARRARAGAPRCCAGCNGVGGSRAGCPRGPASPRARGPRCGRPRSTSTSTGTTAPRCVVRRWPCSVRCAGRRPTTT